MKNFQTKGGKILVLRGYFFTNFRGGPPDPALSWGVFHTLQFPGGLPSHPESDPQNRHCCLLNSSIRKYLLNKPSNTAKRLSGLGPVVLLKYSLYVVSQFISCIYQFSIKKKTTTVIKNSIAKQIQYKVFEMYGDKMYKRPESSVDKGEISLIVGQFSHNTNRYPRPNFTLQRAESCLIYCCQYCICGYQFEIKIVYRTSRLVRLCLINKISEIIILK